MMNHISINPERLWSRIQEMARIGATPGGGVCRLALSEEDRQGRDLFVQWCRQAGCVVQVDVLGNIFARREGARPELPAVLLGSHLDSQPTGGKYDGAYGVLAALEVAETLNDHKISTEAAIEIVSWTNEEGARFTPAMLASGAYSGVFTEEFVLGQRDQDGISFEQALNAIGYRGEKLLGADRYKAALEVHIEQGPVLEAEQLPIGVVTGVQGIKWYDLRIQGKEAHAGPTPMSFRQDPVRSLIKVLELAYGLAERYAPDAKVTIGQIQAGPGVRNTVPGHLELTLDIRHPDSLILDQMDGQLKTELEELAGNSHTVMAIKEVWHSPPVNFDQRCICAVSRAAEKLGLPSKKMVSGAGHDSVYLARVMPVGMIFIPCRDGLSHNELEHIEVEHATAGANVLLHAALELAGGEDLKGI